MARRRGVTIKSHLTIAGQIFGRDSRVVDVIDRLDRIGFDVGRTHVSLWNAIVTVSVVVLMLAIARFGSRLARRLFGRMTRLDPTQQLLGEKLVSIAVWVTSALIAIDILGISLTALTVFSGAFGLAVGFGLQKTFGNLIAGIILLMDRSIKPGDVIAVSAGGSGGTTVGQVKKIGIRAVSVTTRDNIEYLIPNENLMTSQVENWSFSNRDVRVRVPVGIAYDSDIEQAEALMLEAARSCKRVLTRPAPSVWLKDFGDSSIDFEVMVWVRDPEEGVGNVRSDVLKAMWRLFRDHQIEIPFPQRDLHIKSWPQKPDTPTG
jgi:small-conductance mechanosensitive channel